MVGSATDTDGKGSGQPAANKNPSQRVTVAAPDSNDILREEGEDEVRRRFDQARLFDDLHSDPSEPISFKDFHAYMPDHKYIFAPTGQLWPAASVNARLPSVRIEGGKKVDASTWLDKNQPVEQMTWAPGQPLLIRDRLIAEGGWVQRDGCTICLLAVQSG